MKSIALLFALLGCAAAPVAAQAPEVGIPAPQVGVAVEPWSRAFEELLDELAPQMAAERIEDREKAQQTLEKIALGHSRPGAEIERAALARAMAARLGPEQPRALRIWLLRLLEKMGGEECVPQLAATLDDADPVVREFARAALEHNASKAAEEAIQRAVMSAKTSGRTADRVALIRTLSARRNCASTVLEEVAGSAGESREEQSAALEAWAAVDNPESWKYLLSLYKNDPGTFRKRDVPVVLARLFERLLEIGKIDASPFPRWFAWSVSPENTLPHLTVSALRIGALQSNGAKGYDVLRPIIRGTQNPELRVHAARIAVELVHEDVTRALIEDLLTADHDTQALLLDVLAERGDPRALEVVTRHAVNRGEEPVRVAAISALGRLGNADAVFPLVTLAASGTETETIRAAAREQLARGLGANCDRTLVEALERATLENAMRNAGDLNPNNDEIVELMTAVAARQQTAATKVILATAKHSRAVEARSAAFAALGELGDATTQDTLIASLSRETAPRTRDAIVDALVRLNQRTSDPESLIESAMRGFEGADAEAQIGIIALLGKLQGPTAHASLAKILAHASRAPDVRVATIEALASWREPVVLKDLVAALSSTSAYESRAALSGVLRLVRHRVGPNESDALPMIEACLARATRREERELALAALRDLRSRRALDLAVTLIADPEVKQAAASAAIEIARRHAPLDAEAAHAALKRVEAELPIAETQSAVARARDEIDRHRGVIALWQYCGPYFEAGKNAEAIFAQSFAPEASASGDANATWQPLDAADRGDPWMLDLTRIDTGSHRCIYARSRIHSPVAQRARLYAGSDDAIKMWLNGALVHANLAFRAAAPDSDHVDVELKDGANDLLVKIIQGSGGWGFCVRVAAPDGAPLANLRLTSE
ncbi:MAG: HEAT repeat domain-containing protein [Planctomycetota bacterium]